MTVLETPPALDRPAGIRDMPHVKGACESWARWCASGHTARAVSMTGRLMMGAPGNTCPGWLDDVAARRGHDPWCPLCHGTGRLPMKLAATVLRSRRVCPCCEGESDPQGKPTDRRLRCHRCHATGIVEIVSQWVNPAAIRSTAPPGLDWQSWMLDELITGWRDEPATFWMNRVVIREYFWNGTQDMKAKRLGISMGWYKKRLRAAYLAIDQAIFDTMPRG